ncbi:MAG: hypothetical protein MK008_02120 [Bdellovibrionales bacterium]|nr:hypothetical protein [Bdellovibrionales bacterium]
MERINPVLECITEVQSSLMSGESIKAGVVSFIKQGTSTSLLHRQCKSFLIIHESGQELSKLTTNINSELTISLLHLLERGLKGEPIAEYLEELKQFTVEQSEKDIANFLSLLPFKAMIPLFLFQLPALLIILFGPLIVNLQESFK